MIEDKRTVSKPVSRPVTHSVHIDKRELVTVIGVIDVISFDDEAVIAETEMGVLFIRGENLHVNRLNLDNGELIIDGLICNVTYEDQSNLSKNKQSFLGKLFK